jgi:hypothetical protein
MSEYRIEKLNDDNIECLLPLYEKAFGKPILLTELRAKFNTRKWGLNNLGFISIYEGKAVGFYGVFPCEVEIDGKKVLIAQSGDTMVDADHRRQKLFVTLAKRTFEFCNNNGVALIYGFPNKFSFPSFIKKLDWIHIHNIVAHSFKVKCIPFLAMERFLKVPKSIFSKYQNWVLSKKCVQPFYYQSLNHSQNDILIIKDLKFITYKSYFKKYFILINNKLIWVKPISMYLLIGDVEKCKKEEFDVILQKLKRLCFILGIPHLRFQCSENSVLNRFVKENGVKLDIEYPVGCLALNPDIEVEKFKFTLADYDTY